MPMIDHPIIETDDYEIVAHVLFTVEDEVHPSGRLDHVPVIHDVTLSRRTFGRYAVSIDLGTAPQWMWDVVGRVAFDEMLEAA